MNRLGLVHELSEKCGLAKPAAQQIVTLFFDEIACALSKGDRIEIRGLCSFDVKKYQGYQGRNPKTGSTIQVKSKRLPIFKCGKELRERVDRAGTNHTGKAKRVLIIDDNASLCGLFEEWLGEYFTEDKLDVYTATDASSGIELAKECRPDLIVLDVVLDAEISGKDIYERLTQDPAADPMRFIFISGQLAYKPKNEIFFQKPIDWHAFIEAVAKITGLKLQNLP